MHSLLPTTVADHNCQSNLNEASISDYVHNLYGDISISACPFSEMELAELDLHNELLVYLPAKLSMSELCKRFGIKANVNFENETMIKNVMVNEDQWFITSAQKTPELIYQTGVSAKRTYEDEGLHGM